MILSSKTSIPFYHFENLKIFGDQIHHFITTRNHSASYSTENCFTIGLNGVVDNEIVLKNRKIIADQIGFSNDSYVFASQVHGNRVAVIGDKDRGRGAFERSSYLPDVDAMITNTPEICLISQAADCVPIIFFDPVKLAVGVAHAGWKGTVLKIAAETVAALCKEFNSNPSDLIVGIGPSIGPCCYEVGNEVIDQVHKSFKNTEGLIMENKKFSKLVFNLWEANKRTLIDSGIRSENIEIAELCTKCNNSIFFSARAGDKGRFGAGIMIKG